jgi:hypothetical protein
MDGCASVLEVVEFPVVAVFDVEDSSFFVWQRFVQAVRSAARGSSDWSFFQTWSDCIIVLLTLGYFLRQE